MKRLNGNELRGRTEPEDHIVTVRPRSDGHLDLPWENGAGGRASGVLTRVT